jgi:anti-anti-sigma factor
MQDMIKAREFDNIVIVDLPERGGKEGQDFRLKTKLMDVISKNKNVGVNMKAASFIDSGIVTALLAAEKAIRQTGKKLTLISPSEQARELFAVTSINRIIAITDNEENLLP